MLRDIDPRGTAAAALSERARPRGSERPDRDAHSAAWATAGRLRIALAAAACCGVVAFVLGAGNRLTRGPWFVYPPEVSFVPPFGSAAWRHAFILHQQSPLYALCGGYDVGGMESITIYKFLYWWEWSRIASIVLFAAALFAALVLLLFGPNRAARRLRPWLWTGLAAAVVYFVLRYFADHAGLFATINIGQHRHALDITVASAALAVLIVAAIAPERALAGPALPRLAWALVIALDIAFGALFEAMDAGPLWTTFPGYADALLPTPDRLFAFHPLWRNLAENGYLIQACHRVLSIGLWAAAAVAAALVLWRGRPAAGALVLFGALTLEAALGIVALRPGQPVVASILHQVLAIAVLVAALLPPGLWELGAAAGRKPLVAESARS